jgi:phage gpG-like protein
MATGGFPVRGLRLDTGLKFDFDPSIGIMAKRLETFGHDLTDFKVPLTRAIRQVMIPSFRKNFQEGGRPEPWDPLSDYAIEMRGNSGPILIRSGRLFQTVQSSKIWAITPTFATITDLPENVWYGKLHQAGFGGFAKVVSSHGGDMLKALATVGTRNDKATNIPARPFILFQDEDTEKIERVFGRWLAQVIDSFGRGVSLSADSD